MNKNLLKHIVNYSTRKNIHSFAIFSKISINQHSNNISNKYFSSIHKPIIKSKNDPIIELKNDPIIELKNDPIIEFKNDPIIESKNEPLFYKLCILKNNVPVITSYPIDKIHLDEINLDKIHLDKIRLDKIHNDFSSGSNKYGYYLNKLFDLICLAVNVFIITLGSLYWYNFMMFIMKKQECIFGIDKKSKK
jgi:hypothetical protein